MVSLSDHKARPLIATEAEENGALFSPDGKWILYQSSEAGRFPPEVYAEPFPRTGERFHVVASGDARWSRGGREVVYLSQQKVMAVDVTTAPRFVVGKPRVLFANPYDYPIDVSSDGERIITVKREPSEGSYGYHVNVVLGDVGRLLQPAP